MDLRYERLRYHRQLSERIGRGMICHDAWHVWGCYTQRREDRYKKIDRETIRRWPESRHPGRRRSSGAA